MPTTADNSDAKAFLDRVFKNLPRVSSRFDFNSWRYAGRPTQEGVGLLPIRGVDPEKLIARVMDIDHYVGNVEHVIECRSIPDATTSPPESVRFYQRINVPVLGKLHTELVLFDMGVRDGYRVAAWQQVAGSANRLSAKQGIRTDYNVGAWLVKDGVVGYALASAPIKGDVGRLKFAAMTKGADAAASRVVSANIEGMVRWSKRS